MISPEAIRAVMDWASPVPIPSQALDAMAVAVAALVARERQQAQRDLEAAQTEAATLTKMLDDFRIDPSILRDTMVVALQAKNTDLQAELARRSATGAHCHDCLYRPDTALPSPLRCPGIRPAPLDSSSVEA